jgi:tetratricopeptide (TPR) repeat protein
MIRQSPWVGSGLGAYSVYYPKYKQPQARESRYPHNIVVHLWVELGLVGLGILIVWIGVVVKRGWNTMRGGGAPGVRIGQRLLLLAAGVYLFNNLFEITWALSRETYLDWCLLLGAVAGLGAHDTAASSAPSSNEKPVMRLAKRPALLVAGVPLLLGAVFVNGVILRPMIADSCLDTATNLLKYGDLRRDEPDIWRLARKMLRYQPDNPWYHHWVAQVANDLGQKDRAREEFAEAIRLHPLQATIHADFGRFEQQEGNYDRARSLIEQAVELYPRNARYRYMLAQLEKDAGNRDAARKHIDAALERLLDARKREEYLEFREGLAVDDDATTPAGS